MIIESSRGMNLSPYLLLMATTIGACAPSMPDEAAQSQITTETAFSQATGDIELASSKDSRYLRQEELDAPFGRILIGEYGYPDGEVGHRTPGRLDVSYISEDERRRDFKGAVEVGSMGRMSEWAISYKFTESPVIYASGGLRIWDRRKVARY